MPQFYFTLKEVEVIENEVDKMDAHVAMIYQNMVAMKEHLERLCVCSYTPIDRTMMEDFIEDLSGYVASGRCQDSDASSYMNDVVAKWPIALNGGITIPNDITSVEIIAFDVVDL